jgi:cell division protein FtsZ
VNEAPEVVTSAADANANVIFGAVIDEGKDDAVTVTVSRPALAVSAAAAGAPRRRRS